MLRGNIKRSHAQWVEFGEKNLTYFQNFKNEKFFKIKKKFLKFKNKFKKSKHSF